jgi:hypothetical protein
MKLTAEYVNKLFRTQGLKQVVVSLKEEIKDDDFAEDIKRNDVNNTYTNFKFYNCSSLHDENIFRNTLCTCSKNNETAMWLKYQYPNNSTH